MLATDDQVPASIDSDMSLKDLRQNWSRLIQKIYHVDSLLCPKLSGSMRIISFIENEEIIEKILKHPLPGQVMKSGPADPKLAAELCGIAPR